jgi:hypothetical protein
MAQQFTIYTSSDGSAPSLTGQTGALLTVLDAILVNGYGAKSAAGWSKPFSNASSIGCYKNSVSGTGFGVVINDSGPNGTSTFKEAWATGWESIAGVGSPVGSGSGQFPTAAQLLTSGHVVIRKSATADSTVRTWICFADAYTFYLFILDGTTGGVYQSFMFGDIYSLKTTSDAYRCMIIGGATENAGSNNAVDNSSSVANTCTGHFMPRTYGGGGTSITCGKAGDIGKGAAGGLGGIVQTPNGPDGAYYLSPIWVSENSASTVRGRLRGLWHNCHAAGGFSDGQTFSGAGDFAGKTFQCVKQGTSASPACFVLETSATLETN